MDSKCYFLKLIKSYICNETVEYCDSTDWDEILNLAKLHSVQSIIFFAVNKLEDKPPIYDDLKKYCFGAAQVSVLQELSMKQVIAVLNSNNINHTLIKGYILRNYYPDRKARSFGDIDFLIDEKDREKCHTILTDMGYKYIEEYSSLYVWTYDNGLLHLEVHTAIIYETLFNNFDYIRYFKEKSNNKELINGCTYELRKEDHFLFIMVHLAKHFYHMGAGIRMILDIVVFMQKFGQSMDFEYIRKELCHIRLERFSDIIFNICKKYFNSEVDCKPINGDILELVVDYIVSHGVYGFDNKNIIDIQFNQGGNNRILLLIKKLFPDRNDLENYYPQFYKYPLFYAWLRRWIYVITNKEKRKSIYIKFLAVCRRGKDSIKHIEILKAVGLK